MAAWGEAQPGAARVAVGTPPLAHHGASGPRLRALVRLHVPARCTSRSLSGPAARPTFS